MRECDVPFERVIPEALPDINDTSDLRKEEPADIADLWQDNEYEMKRKMDLAEKGDPALQKATRVKVDAKLEEFLTAHSNYLTPMIANFLRRKKAREPGVQEMITDLALIQFERNQFMKTIKKMEESFNQRLVDYKRYAEEKAKEGMEIVRIQMTELFKKEWSVILDDFHKCRDFL